MNAFDFMQPQEGKITSRLTKHFYIINSCSLTSMWEFVKPISDTVQQQSKKDFC
jgi:hypothetical protein